MQVPPKPNRPDNGRAPSAILACPQSNGGAESQWRWILYRWAAGSTELDGRIRGERRRSRTGEAISPPPRANPADDWDDDGVSCTFFVSINIGRGNLQFEVFYKLPWLMTHKPCAPEWPSHPPP